MKKQMAFFLTIVGVLLSLIAEVVSANSIVDPQFKKLVNSYDFSKVIDLLQDKNVYIDQAVNSQGDSALFVAIRIDYLDAVEDLLNHGAQVNLRNIQGETAFMQVQSWAVGQVLLNAGTNIQAHDKDGNTVLMQLLKKNADLDVLQNLIQKLPAAEDLQIQNQQQHTALSYAAYKGSFEQMQLLVEAGADIQQAAGPQALNPLMWAIKSSKESTQKVKLLINEGGDRNYEIDLPSQLARDKAKGDVSNESVNSLQLAVRYGSPEVLKLLLIEDHKSALNRRPYFDEHLGVTPDTSAPPKLVDFMNSFFAENKDLLGDAIRADNASVFKFILNSLVTSTSTEQNDVSVDVNASTPTPTSQVNSSSASDSATTNSSASGDSQGAENASPQILQNISNLGHKILPPKHADFIIQQWTHSLQTQALGPKMLNFICPLLNVEQKTMAILATLNLQYRASGVFAGRPELQRTSGRDGVSDNEAEGNTLGRPELGTPDPSTDSKRQKISYLDLNMNPQQALKVVIIRQLLTCGDLAVSTEALRTAFEKLANKAQLPIMANKNTNNNTDDTNDTMTHEDTAASEDENFIPDSFVMQNQILNLAAVANPALVVITDQEGHTRLPQNPYIFLSTELVQQNLSHAVSSCQPDLVEYYYQDSSLPSVLGQLVDVPARDTAGNESSSTIDNKIKEPKFAQQLLAQHSFEACGSDKDMYLRIYNQLAPLAGCGWMDRVFDFYNCQPDSWPKAQQSHPLLQGFYIGPHTVK